MRHGNLARHLRVLRAERGLSLTEASERIGVTRDTLSDIERGRRHPYTPTLTKIARGYGVPVEELVEETEAALPLAGAPEAGQSGQEWAKDFGAELHGMTDEEWNNHVRSLGSVEEIAEGFRDLLEEAKTLHSAYSAHKWQRPEEKDRRVALSRDLRELRTNRLVNLAHEARVRKADELFEEVLQALDDVAV